MLLARITENDIHIENITVFHHSILKSMPDTYFKYIPVNHASKSHSQGTNMIHVYFLSTDAWEHKTKI